MGESGRVARYKRRVNIAAVEGPYRKDGRFVFFGVNRRGSPRYWCLRVNRGAIVLFSREQTEKERQWWDQVVQPRLPVDTPNTHSDLPSGSIRDVLMGLLSDEQRAELVAQVMRGKRR